MVTCSIPRNAQIQQIALNRRILRALHLTVLRQNPGSGSRKRFDLNQRKLAFAPAAQKTTVARDSASALMMIFSCGAETTLSNEQSFSSPNHGRGVAVKRRTPPAFFDLDQSARFGAAKESTHSPVEPGGT
jgi:hypothetical protein